MQEGNEFTVSVLHIVTHFVYQKIQANKNSGYLLFIHTWISFVLSHFVVWAIEWNLKAVFPTVYPDEVDEYSFLQYLKPE